MLSEKNVNGKLIGYARSTDSEADYLHEQIRLLKNIGCNIVFSEIASLSQEEKPELNKAFECLSQGDQLVLTKLDRAFKSKYECTKVVRDLLDQGIYFRTLSGLIFTNNSSNLLSPILNFLNELDDLEKDILAERKKEIIINKKISGENLGGRPKISSLKSDLVIRLRNDGFSYRSIRSQTGIALSTIRKIIIESEEY